MGVFNNFPYANFHELNADWIIEQVRKVMDEWEEYKTDMDLWKLGVDDQLAEFQTWFDNLDVQDEVRTVMNELILSGEFIEITSPQIVSATEAWLAAHITPTTPAVDDTLSISGAAADAKVTGDRITDLKEDLISINDNNVSVTFELGTIDSSGRPTTRTNRARTGYINIDGDMTIDLTGSILASIFYYTSENVFISSTDFISDFIRITPPENAAKYRAVAKYSSDADVDVDVITANFHLELWLPKEDKEDAELIKEELTNFYNSLTIKKGLIWEQGSLSSSNGNESTSTSRIRNTGFLSCNDYDEVVCDESLYLNIFFYLDRQYGTSYFISTTGFITDTHKYSIRDNVPEDATYFKVVLRYASGTSVPITPSDVTDQTAFTEQFVTNAIQNEMNPVFNNIDEICNIKKKWNLSSGTSGACFAIKNNVVQLWSFNVGADDNLTDASWYRREYDPVTKEFSNSDISARHTLGHVNSCSYNEMKDAFICGNGSGDYTLPGKIYIIENAYAKSDFLISDALIIDFNNYGSKPNAIWGDSNNDLNNVIFVITNDGYDLYKIILGEDSTELEEGTLQKITGFNGTYKILKHWEYGNVKKDYDNVVQGAFYNGNRVFWGFGHNTGVVPIHWCKPFINGDVETGGVNYKIYDSNGDEITQSISSAANYEDDVFAIYYNKAYMIDIT